MNGTLAFIQIALTSTLRMSVPIVLAAVGAVFSTRAGVVAFGCEGMMLMGAFCGVYGALRTGSNMVGVLFAIVGGILISMLHAYLHVRHKVNGTLSSVCINLIGLSLTELLVKVVWNSNQYSPPITPFSVFAPEWLKNLPFIGPILASQYMFFYITILIVILSNIFMYRTKFGLRLRMVGDNPRAAYSLGINTVGYKYFGVGVCGALSGLAGAYLSMAMLSCFQTNITAGRGYIAMVACNLARSTPYGAALSSIFFGFFNSLQTMFQNVNFPSQILMAMPYFFTLLASLVQIRSLRGPTAVGSHYDDE
jgi:simple sugar transport system permease protein